jgi:hypothetical protein
MAAATAVGVRDSSGGENTLRASALHPVQRRQAAATPIASVTSKTPCSAHRYW